jgi:hypothetical protein
MYKHKEGPNQKNKAHIKRVEKAPERKTSAAPTGWLHVIKIRRQLLRQATNPNPKRNKQHGKWTTPRGDWRLKI